MNGLSARSFSALVVFMPILFLGGCFSANPKNIAAFTKPYQADVSAQQYILMPPDSIQVQCARVPQINGQVQRIRPDGKVSFETLGDVEVAGLTPEQAANVLERKVAGLYTLIGEHPIDVRVTAMESKTYFVLGQVFSPGRKLYTGRDTLLSALADAQLNPMAWKQKIQVIRPSEVENIKPRVFEVNYNWMAVHGDLRKNVLLQEGDIVYVPPTPLAAVAMVIEEFIRPIARAFSGAYTVNRGMLLFEN